MKRYASFFLIVLALIGMTSCKMVIPTSMHSPAINSTPTIIILDNVARFTTISSQQGIEVLYEPNGKPSITITTNLKDTSLLDIRVKNGELIAAYKPYVSSIGKNVKTTVQVTGYAGVNDFLASSSATIRIAPLKIDNKVAFSCSSSADIIAQDLTCRALSVSASSSADVRINKLHTDELNTSVSSGADTDIKFWKGNTLTASVSSGGDITIEGTGHSGRLSASSGGDINAGGLTLSTAIAEASSGSDIVCNARQLQANNSSGGEVRNIYTTEP